MGVLLYECMVGHLPFEGNNPAQVLRRVLDGTYPNAAAERPVVGARWSAVLDRALAHAPAERYADASAMRAAIEEELARLNVGDAPQLLASWLDDPAGSEERHRKAMIDRLVALADVARKARDPLSAAGDYNRALAHAPDDPNLLRIVAGLHRAEARARLVKQAAVVTMLMVGLGVVAFAVGRTFRHAPAPPIVADTAVAPPPSVPLPVISSAPSAVASVAPRPTSVPVLRISPVPSAKPVERTMVLELQPPMGLKVAIDDQPAKNVQSGDSVVLDGKAHVLTFGCSVCVAVPRTVAPGDKDDTIAVHVSLKPANLTIVGDGNMTYEIVEHPMAVVRVGANSVLLPSEFEPVTVKQIESGATVTVRLHAGHAVEADFP
jgi:serine/threonine-protein kinase